MSREKTNSITQLVKIVAREEVEEYMAGHQPDYIRAFNEAVQKFGDGYLANVKSSVAKAGNPWCEEEEALLIQEVRTAIAQIAMNHKRSAGAIKARITTKKLIDYD